jgi:hypothetical protein
VLTVFLLAWRTAAADPTNELPGQAFPGSVWFDQTHSVLADRITRTATWPDVRFGDECLVTGRTAKCTAMIGAEVLLERGGELSVNVRGRADFELPHLEHRARVFADNVRNNLLPGVDPTGVYEDFRIGTRWRLFQTVRSLFDCDVGIRARLPPEPFANLWYGYGREVGGLGFMFEQSEFWTIDDHFGELTVVTLTYPLGGRYLFRSVTAGKLSQRSEGLEAEETLGVAVQFAGGSRRLDLLGSLFTERWNVVNCRLSVGWRTRWLRPWNTVYVVPEIQFPAEEDFHARPGVRVGFETVYW